MHVPTLWDGFDGNAREVSEVRAVCYGVASGSAVLRVSRAVRAVTAVIPLILLRHILENKLEYRRTRPTHTPYLERLCPRHPGCGYEGFARGVAGWNVPL